MSKRPTLEVLMYEDIITIDPMGARFACSGTDKHGIDRLGPALPEQKRDWKRKQREIAKLTTKEAFITNLIFTVFFAAFLVGRMSLGSNPIEDVQTMMDMAGKLMR